MYGLDIYRISMVPLKIPHTKNLTNMYCKMCVLFGGENLRDLRIKSPKRFLKTLSRSQIISYNIMLSPTDIWMGFPFNKVCDHFNLKSSVC